MRITDVAAVARLAHAAGAIVVADNTFCSPLLQNPLTLGADVVVHSTTKFINGHSDVVGGAVISKTAETGELVAHWANALGLTGGAWDSWLTLRGLRTIDARMRVHQANAAAVVELLSNHPAVQAVYYPGLATHPGHCLLYTSVRSGVAHAPTCRPRPRSCRGPTACRPTNRSSRTCSS